LAARLREEREKPTTRPLIVRRGINKEGVVLIGVSTGGPRTLEDILPVLPVDFSTCPLRLPAPLPSA
jgi:two-component system, chemotaxis family, protein-glutamate methylesterase/glutaminase